MSRLVDEVRALVLFETQNLLNLLGSFAVACAGSQEWVLQLTSFWKSDRIHFEAHSVSP